MTFKKYLMCACAIAVSVVATTAYSQALPVYIAPANKVGGALAEGITQTLIRRGFAANDPRILQTITAVGARIPTIAAAAGSGANWILLAGRLSPWVTVGVLVYQGVKWYFDSAGNVVTKTEPAAVVVGSVVNGASCYYAIGGGACASTPEEAVTQFVLATTSYTDLTLINLTPDAVGSTAYNQGRRYTGSISGHRVGDANTLWPASGYFIYLGLASATCPVGQAALAGACVPSKLDKYTPALVATASQTPQIAYNGLSQAAKDAALQPELAAETANRIWKDAALQPGFQGVPWSANDPVAGGDFLPHKSAHPEAWPITSDLNSPVPTTGTSPITSPYSNPNQTSAPTTAAKVDLGVDPGVGAPTLENTPTELFKPIKDTLQPWLSWQVPSHSAQCPTWQASPVIAGHVFSINVSEHCAVADQYRTLIVAAALAAWIAVAAFIVLSA